MKKWIIRVSVSLLSLLLISIAFVAFSYLRWNDRERDRALSESQVIDTKLGKIEYAMVGDGYPFLMFHGNPGGYDQGIAGPKRFPEKFTDRKVIAVSRPGYLRTPLSSGATFEEQADLFAALLDELKIEKVFAFGASGGGYAALQFAIRHPDRCYGLILLAPSVNYEPLPEGGYEEAMRDIPVPNFLAWLLSGPLFELVATDFIPGLDLNNPDQVAGTKDVLKSVLFRFDERLPGIRNDIMQRNYPEIDSWPLETIPVPALLLHGDKDENSDYQGSVYVASKIPNAKLITFKGGDHNMTITRGDEIQHEIRQFVSQIMQSGVSTN